MASLAGAGSLPPGVAVTSCYEQLRREIQALITENEELRKLVDLIKENQELKNVLRNQALSSDTPLSSLTSTRSTERGQSSILSPGQAGSGTAPWRGLGSWGSPAWPQELSLVDCPEETPVCFEVGHPGPLQGHLRPHMLPH